MSQTAHKDLEKANNADSDQTSSIREPSQLSGGASSFGDSSGPLFSIYSKAAEEEDNKMVERWQKDANGILIFTGLFSAAVAALLTVTVQDLRPNSQDTSSFYLGNIYQVLADPNATRTSLPPSGLQPPPFFPPRYAIWVNSLWFLSLVMSLSCALLATSLHQWARRYLRLTQPARCSPEKRARMRAFLADGLDRIHVPWAVEGLPTLLHLSLFLFFGGLVVFLFHVNREVFLSVVWWIGLISMVYVSITLLPLIWHDSPYHAPLSTPAWCLYANIPYATLKFLYLITTTCCGNPRTWIRWNRTWVCWQNLSDCYHRWMLGGVERAAEETASASERLSEIDIQIFDWTTSALEDDTSLEKFFEAIPGFVNSKLVTKFQGHLSDDVSNRLSVVAHGFLGRTWSSNLVSDSEKLRRLDITMNAMALIRISDVSSILSKILFEFWEGVPQSIEMGHTLARWCTNNDHYTALYARSFIGRILGSTLERNDSWIALAALVLSSLAEHELCDDISDSSDSLLLAILIQLTRQNSSGDVICVVLQTLSKLDIGKAVPRLQHDFCTLWNELVQEARKQGPSTSPVRILRRIRHPYIALHQGTDAAPTVFSASTENFDPILLEPSSYPFCKIASHRSASSPSPTDGGSITLQQVEQVDNVVEPPSSSNPTTASRIRPTSHGPDMTPPTNPVQFSSASSTTFVVAAPQDTTLTATLSHPSEGSEQQDSDIIVAPSAEPGSSQIWGTASTHAPTSTLPSIPTSLLNTPSKSYDASVASSVSNFPNFALSSISSFIPASRPTGDATLPRLRARGLVNTGNMCFANAILQLLVNSPPSWNLFRELRDLKGQRGAGVSETGGGATPLVDASVRFFNEFIVEESPSTQQQSQPATGGTSRADSFEPTYLYDAMKEGQLERLLKGGQQDAEEFLGVYLDALEEELPAVLASIEGGQSASAALNVEEREVSQSGQTQGFHSPIRTSNKLNFVPKYWRSIQLDVLPDSVHTVQDALMRVSQSQSSQDGPSGLSDASQQMFIEVLPPGLVLHLKRFQYDAATGGTIKNRKPVQFSPELEIPFDVMVPTARQPAKSGRE